MPQTPVTVLSDGAVGPRALGEIGEHGPSPPYLGLVPHSPCASSTLPSASRAGRMRRPAPVRKVLTSPTWLNISAGVCGTDRCDARSTSVDRRDDAAPERNGRDELHDSQSGLQSGAGSRLARDLCCRAFRLDHRLRDSPAMRGTVLDVTNRRRGAMAFAPSHGIPAADALLVAAARCSIDAQKFAHPSSTADLITIKVPPQNDGFGVRFGERHDHPQVLDGLPPNCRQAVICCFCCR